MRTVCSTAAAICVCLALPALAQNRGGGTGGGPVGEHGVCLDEAVRAALVGTPGPTYGPRTPILFPFYPQGGTFFGDLDCSNFVDLDPTPVRRDYGCTALVANGHAGIDSALRSFGEMDIGVPVFAALPGVVVLREDGQFDRNTGGSSQSGNLVALSHPGGVLTYYLHLRNGSVAVNLGDSVAAGQQLGLTASSGNSFGPHLHFEVRDNGVVYEPFAGACRPGAPGWLNQPARPTTTYLNDAAPSYVDLGTVPGWPHASPRTGQLALTDDYHWLWIDVQWLPPNSTYRQRWIRPDGSLEWETPVYPFNNAEFYGRAWYWFWWWIDGMHHITGTWRLQVEINGALLLDAPVEVRGQRTAGFNRPPAALGGVAFEPAAPAPTDALFCRVSTSLLYDDPDYDIVRYRYQWSVNGQSIRDVTTAGHADAIPAGSLAAGATVTCTVMPGDGVVNGPAATVSYTMPGGCDPDFTCDGNADQDDVGCLINTIAGNPGCECQDPDFNRDGNVDQDDVAALINVVAGGGCP